MPDLETPAPHVVVAPLREYTAEMAATLGRWRGELSSTDSGLPADEAGIRQTIESDNAEILIAWKRTFDGELPMGAVAVGMAVVSEVASIRPDKRYLQVEEVFVDSRHRGGIGRILMGACLAEADKRGLQRVQLQTEDDREAAMRLYQDMGWELLPEKRTLRRTADA